jgi:hypothetical protein
VLREIFHCQYFEVVFQLRSSFMGGHLRVMHFSTLTWSHEPNFNNLIRICSVVAEIFHYQYFKVVLQLRLSSMGGHLHIMHLSTLPWSNELKFKI